MKAILSVDTNWGIGFKGSLLERVPEDMEFFKRMTLGKVVVMGRETFDSLPGRQPLKDRINIVLSRYGHFEDDRLIICRSMGELFKELEKYASEDIFVIGGESLYRQLLPYCNEAYITKFGNTYQADRHFINLDEASGWTSEILCEALSYNDFKYSRVRYVNTRPLLLSKGIE